MYHQCFVSAITQILQESGLKVSVNEITSEAEVNYEIVSSLGITGDIQGYFIIRVDKQSAIRIVNKISESFSMELDSDVFSQFHKAAIGEITNQIAGRTVNELANNKYDCLITPPTIITGSNIYTAILDLKESRYFEVITEQGTLHAFIGIKKIKTIDKADGLS